MNRNVLLIEPNYKNKYPPMGLMKLSTYYKKLGDKVTFFKGDLKNLVLDDIFDSLNEQLYANDDSVFWEDYKPQICKYIKTGHISLLEDVPGYNKNPIVMALFDYYRKFFVHKDYFKPDFLKYDVVCITTLFTFYWKITIDTINFVKNLCKKKENVFVGGVMASILCDQVKDATGIEPIRGTLDAPGILDKDNDMIIDTLPLDYSILEEVDYHYPASNAYFGYMTRGCVNKCSFCAVPKLEPQYKNFLSISDQIRKTEKVFGPKKDLLLLDNNVLASPNFNDIIDDIKKAGFTKNSKYEVPNEYELAIRNLKKGINDKGYIRKCVEQFHILINKGKSNDLEIIYDKLSELKLLYDYTAKKKSILDSYDFFRPYFEEMYKKKRKRIRHVDFNQGIDSRLVTDEKMKKMAEIPVKPLRIAFDHWDLHEIYERAIRSAVKFGHKDLSNYILYNYKDKPSELYKRLKLNVKLSAELDANIYSFPMKYHPIEDPAYFSNRNYIGKYWNRKFIRAIQSILNSTKGKVAKGYTFFCKAFGSNIDEFYKILYMPEAMIIYRFEFENNGMTEKWWSDYSDLSKEEKENINRIIEKNDFKNIEQKTDNKKILKVLRYYQITH